MLTPPREFVTGNYKVIISNPYKMSSASVLLSLIITEVYFLDAACSTEGSSFIYMVFKHSSIPI
jgi:hypothetical protein